PDTIWEPDEERFSKPLIPVPLQEIWKLVTGDAFFLTSGNLSASGRMLMMPTSSIFWLY
ncbi:hypothetical protein pipiens_006408, partial [Culex pipiens pipiens]